MLFVGTFLFRFGKMQIVKAAILLPILSHPRCLSGFPRPTGLTGWMASSSSCGREEVSRASPKVWLEIEDYVFIYICIVLRRVLPTRSALLGAFLLFDCSQGGAREGDGRLGRCFIVYLTNPFPIMGMRGNRSHFRAPKSIDSSGKEGLTKHCLLSILLTFA